MTASRRVRDAMPSVWSREDGAVTIEFVLVLPIVLSIFLLGIDAGITQLRQVFLDRAMDMAVREVRLGYVSEQGRLSELICQRTAMLPNCLSNISVEMRPVSTETFAGLDDQIQCIDRQSNITPAVVFNPGIGGQAQELMLIRVCVVADPFIRLTGFLNSMTRNDNDEYVLVGKSVFVNEPRS